MSYINVGDLLVTRQGNKYIATSKDYVKRTSLGGEYVEDWTTFVAVDVLNPESGRHSWLRVSDVAHVAKNS